LSILNETIIRRLTVAMQFPVVPEDSYPAFVRAKFLRQGKVGWGRAAQQEENSVLESKTSCDIYSDMRWFEKLA